MQRPITFSVVYNHDRTGELRKDGTASVLIRAYQSGRSSYFNTGVYVKPSQWCSKEKRVKNHDRERRYNATIHKLRHDLQQAEADLAYQTGGCTLDQLREAHEQNHEKSFIAFCKAELEAERSRIASSSYRNFAQTIRYLEAFNPNMTFNDVNQGTVNAFTNFLFDQELSHNTVQKHFRFFRKYTNQAIRQQLIRAGRNPFSELRMGARQTEIVFLTEEEFQLMREYEPPVDKTLRRHVHECFLFCCYTGLRWVDLTQLTSDNFYETDEGYFMRIKESRKTKKPYLQNIRDLFNNEPDQPSPPELIVKSIMAEPGYQEGDPICRIDYENANTYRRYIKQIAKQLPIRKEVQQRIATHTARHTFGTYMAARIDITVLQKLMGHSNINETMIYVHLTEKRTQSALRNVKW